MIGLDAGNAFDRPPTGVAVYARNLTRSLAAAHPDERFAWYLRSNRYFRSLRSRVPRNVRRRMLESLPWRLSASGLKLYHGLNQRLPPAGRVPMVATFHDLFVITGEYSTPDFRRRFTDLARETAARADHVIAISAHTAGQVASLLNYPRSSITVVHHGVDALSVPSAARRAEILRAIGIARPFVLHVGTLQFRKNIDRIVSAFEASGAGHDLVLAGSSGFGAADILERIGRSPARSRILLTGHVGEAVRASLYGAAKVLLFPSLEEGFGLPAIEAFSCGVPVITSNVSALPEVAGDAALLVDPLDRDAISGALERLLDDAELRQELSRRGVARAGDFSWNRCARETWEVYRCLTRPNTGQASAAGRSGFPGSSGASSAGHFHMAGPVGWSRVREAGERGRAEIRNGGLPGSPQPGDWCTNQEAG